MEVTCPTCDRSDMVEDSVRPEKWLGFCYRCMEPFGEIALLRAPVRLCCGRPHFGAMCFDGKVMCCLCYGRFDVDGLNLAANPDFEGQHEDVCRSCASNERERMEQL